jgi:hypothetical protein
MICFQPTPENEAVIERVRASTGFTVEQVINFALAASEHHSELVKSLMDLVGSFGHIDPFDIAIKKAKDVLRKVDKS